MGSISKKKGVMMDGFLLRDKEAKLAKKIEEHLHKISPEWACASELNVMAGFPKQCGTRAVCTHNTLLKLMHYYNNYHPKGFTMEHKRFGSGDYFRIIRVTEE